MFDFEIWFRKGILVYILIEEHVWFWNLIYKGFSGIYILIDEHIMTLKGESNLHYTQSY